MVHAYYMDSSDEDQRLPHELSPPQDVELEELYKKSGVMHFQISEDNWTSDECTGLLKELRESRGYSYMDICEVSKEKLGDEYDPTIKRFYKEHLHTDEEIRVTIEGGGYFDVRDCEDRWIRVHVTKGDMLVVPAGIYHRFTLDSGNYVRTIRLFIGDPVWTPINRPDAEKHEARKTYLENLAKKFSKGVKA